MSVLDKQNFLKEVENEISNILPKTKTKTLITQISNVLTTYDVEQTNTTQTAADSQELLNLFLNAKKIEGKSPKTIQRYKYIINRLLKATNIPLSKITIFHLRNYLSAERERGISFKTLEGNRSVYASCFGWLFKEGLIETNPCANLAPIKQQKVVRKPYTPVEIERLKEACITTRDKALICFLLSTGCRISEVCNLDRDQIDFQNMEVIVLGKGNKQRVVYIDDIASMALENYLNERKDNSPALFIGRGGKRLQPGGVRKSLHLIGARAHVENVHPHRFRRTLATNLINHGMAIQEVAAILGHENINTTMTYVYINKTNVQNSYRKYI